MRVSFSLSFSFSMKNKAQEARKKTPKNRKPTKNNQTNYPIRNSKSLRRNKSVSPTFLQSFPLHGIYIDYKCVASLKKLE